MITVSKSNQMLNNIMQLQIENPEIIDWTPVEKTTYQLAKVLINSLDSAYEVFPTMDGVIQLEWGDDTDTYIEVSVSGNSITVWKEKENNFIDYKNVTVDSLDKIVNSINHLRLP